MLKYKPPNSIQIHMNIKNIYSVDKQNLMMFPPDSFKVHHNRHGIWKYRAFLQQLQQVAPRVPDQVLRLKTATT